MSALLLALVAAIPATASVHKPPAPPLPPTFGFSAVLGDWMVLQQQPAAAAVYGAAPVGASVSVTVSDGKTSYTVEATVGKDATHQPYGYVDPSGAQLPVVSH